MRRLTFKNPNSFVPVVMAVVMTTGCASSSAGGGNQMQNTVYATHRLVQNLDRTLSSSVNRLNETTAELLTRVDATDRETRRLLSVAEENQIKLDTLQRGLDELTATLYRHLDLSPPSEISSNIPPSAPISDPLGVDSGSIIVRPPNQRGTLPPPTTRAEAQAGAQAEAEQFPEPMAEPMVLDEGADDYYVRARDLYTSEQYADALEQFDSYLRLFPNSANAADAQYWKAHSYFKMGQFDRAVDEFRRLELEYPASGKVPIALHNMAVAQARLGQNEGAVATFQKLIRTYPDDVVADMARDGLRKLQGTN